MNKEQGVLDRVFFGAPEVTSLHDERINDAVRLYEMLDSHRDEEMKANPHNAAFWTDMRLSLRLHDMPSGLAVLEPQTHITLHAPDEADGLWSVRTHIAIIAEDERELTISDIAAGLSLQKRKFSVIPHDADREQVDRNLGRYQAGDARWSPVLSRQDGRIMIPHFVDEELQRRYDTHPTDSPHPKMEADRWVSLARHKTLASAVDVSMLVHPTSDAAPSFTDDPTMFARQMVRFSDEMGAVSQAMKIAAGDSWNPNHQVSLRVAT